MLFQIDGTSVAIMGSLHIFPASNPALPTWAKQAFNWAEDILMEHHPTAVAPHLALPEGESLKHLLLTPDWLAAKCIFGEDLTFERLKPWAALMRISSTFVETSPGVELLLMSEPMISLKRLFFLETPEQLVGIFDSIPANLYAGKFERVLAQKDSIKERTMGLYDAWAGSNQDEFNRRGLLALDEMGEEFVRRIISVRSDAWMATINQAVRSTKRTLIIVGALHLIGDKGIPKLAKKSNHKLVRVI